MMKMTAEDLIALCSLLTNLIALILSYFTYKESKYHPFLTPQSIFMYRAYVRVKIIHPHTMYIFYTVIIVRYNT